MTRRLDKVKTDKIRDLNSKLVTNGLETQNKNKHSNPDKIRCYKHYFHFVIFEGVGNVPHFYSHLFRVKGRKTST